MYIAEMTNFYSDNKLIVVELDKKEYERKLIKFEENEQEEFKSFLRSCRKNINKKKCKIINEKIENLNNDFFEMKKNMKKISFSDLKPSEIIEKGKAKKLIQKKVVMPPLSIDKKYNPPMSFYQKLFIKKISAHYTKQKNRYLSDLFDWQEEIKDIQNYNNDMKEKHEKELEKIDAIYQKRKSKQKTISNAVDELEVKLNNKDTKTIETILQYFLSQIRLPLKNFNHQVTCSLEDDDTLRINVTLPTVDDIKNIKGISIMKNKRLKVEKFTIAELNRLYQDLVRTYIAYLSNALRINKAYFAFENFIINGFVGSKKEDKQVCTISCKLSQKDLYYCSKNNNLDKWYEDNNCLVGKKLSNHTELRKVY